MSCLCDGTCKEMTERPTALGLVQLQATCQEQGLVVFLVCKVVQISAETRSPHCNHTSGKESLLCVSEVMCCFLPLPSFPLSLPFASHEAPEE